jgi:hypothetical protein
MICPSTTFRKPCRRFREYSGLSNCDAATASASGDEVNYNQQYNVRNKENRKLYDQDYYIRNKDERRESMQDYYRRNKDTRRRYDQNYYLQNKDDASEYNRAYNIRNKDYKRDYYRDYNIRKMDALRESSRNYYIRNKDEKLEYTREYYNRNKVDIKQSKHDHYLRNKDKKGTYHQQQYVANKDDPNLYSPRELPTKSWKTPQQVRDYFDSIAQHLCISSHIDWYRISRLQVGALRGMSNVVTIFLFFSFLGWTLFSRFDSLGSALHYAYPEINWELDKFGIRGKKSGQRWLRVKIEELLPGIEIIEDYQHPDLMWGKLSLMAAAVFSLLFYMAFFLDIYYDIYLIECIYSLSFLLYYYLP